MTPEAINEFLKINSDGLKAVITKADPNPHVIFLTQWFQDNAPEFLATPVPLGNTINPTSIDELLKIAADGLDAHLKNGDPRPFVASTYRWFQNNAPQYL